MPTAAPAATVVHWFRRDLRVADNTSLWHASRSGLPVIPLHILSSWKFHHHWTGPNRQHFLCGCLASLDANLRTLGGRLILREGDPVTALESLLRESRAIALHTNADPDPHGRAVEARIREMTRTLGIECHFHADVTLHTPNEVLTQSGQPYRVYTPYSRNWLALPKPAPLGKPENLRTPETLASLPLPDLSRWGWQTPAAILPDPGERAARQRLRFAIEQRISHYAERRDNPALDATSRLSQDLRLGLLSPRTVFHRAQTLRENANPAARASIDTFIRELAWREFYFAILHHFPNVLDEEFNPDWRGLPWDEPDTRFDAWCQGRTGFPLVDAGMRELLATGFMHNRLRMITAMFLTKDLHMDWKLGESWFMRQLVDGEIASNNGGWQWSAGTGADAAPYFRIQNPWTQTARHDPDGTYIRRWIPELAKVEAKRFQAPPTDGRPLAPDYPLPIIDHKTERDLTLARFQAHRAQR